MECSLITRSGGRVEVQLAVRRIEYEGGMAMLGVVTDLSEHNRMQRGLIESQRRFRDLVNLLPQGVWETDLEGNFTFMNRQGREDLGYAEDNPDRPRNVVEVFAPEDGERLRGDIRRVLGGERLSAREYTALRKDGSTFPVLVHSAAIIRDGECVGLRGVTADITELNKTQLQLRHSQLLASLGEMTAGIVHEVNNPLGSVLLYAELLMSEEVSPRTRKDLQIIHDEVKRAAKIMSDLLTYGRRTSSLAQNLDLHQVIGKVIDMREYPQRVNNVTLKTSFQHGVLPVRGDASQLTQVFMNLILNAEEALKENGGGHITVSTWTDGAWAKVSVADDGPGIPAENLSQVFFPFFTTKGVGEGTGLGLSTCYGIVTSHRGLIHAANGKKGGAVFTVELPLATGVDVDEPAEAAVGSAI
jgi:PAS domain S-box-containing protein